MRVLHDEGGAVDGALADDVEDRVADADVERLGDGGAGAQQIGVEDLGADVEAVRPQPRQEPLHAGELDDGRGAADEGAAGAAAATFDESLHLEDVQGVAHRHAGDAELVDELALGGEFVAATQLAAFDTTAEIIGDCQVCRGAAVRDRHLLRIPNT